MWPGSLPTTVFRRWWGWRLELSQFFARLGTKGDDSSTGHTLLSEMDEDVERALESALIHEGIEVATGAQWLRVTADKTGKNGTTSATRFFRP